MSRTHAPSHTTLRQMWDTLNAARRKQGLQPYSYTYLAQMANSSEAIPGEPIHISKSTVAAILNGRYITSTGEGMRKRLAEIITCKMKDLGISVAAQKRKAAKAQEPVVKLIRCSNQGYVTYRRNTYYLGSQYAGQMCTVAPMRDGKSKGIKATTTTASRIAYPIDPEGNQFGYKAAAK